MKHRSGQFFEGLSVRVKEGEFIDKALRRLKKKVRDSGILQTLKQKEFYEPPSLERKRKKAAAKNRWQKYVASQQLPKKHK